MSALFDACFIVLIGEEGRLSLDSNDNGNWTGGRVGSGKLVGSKYGVSAASYPTVDIPNLTLSQAKAIYVRDYWNLIGGDELAPELACIVFDAAVNIGVHGAVQFLQKAVDAYPDGVFGPHTFAAVRASDLLATAIKVHALRIRYMVSLSNWHIYEAGWSRRLAEIPFKATTVARLVGQ